MTLETTAQKVAAAVSVVNDYNIKTIASWLDEHPTATAEELLDFVKQTITEANATTKMCVYSLL